MISEHEHPLQYSYLDNSMDRGAWWATVHGVTKSFGHDWVTKTLSWVSPKAKEQYHNGKLILSTAGDVLLSLSLYFTLVPRCLCQSPTRGMMERGVSNNLSGQRNTYLYPLQQNVAKLLNKGHFSTCGCFGCSLSYGLETIPEKEAGKHVILWDDTAETKD